MNSIASRLFVLCVTLLVWSAGASALGRNLPNFVDLVDAASPAVVNISTTQKIKTRSPVPGMQMPEFPEGSPFGDLFRHFFDQQPGGSAPREREARSLGSGFIVSEDGYILTNNHVVDGADEIIVRLSDRRQLEAEVIGADARSDIAVLRIKADHLPVVKIGKSSDLRVGEWVLAIGSPFGFDHSATSGIVSAKGRSLPRENYVPFIQTDVAINPGNSGGPLFNMDGEVVGVNSQIYSRTGGYMGLSFSIPIEVAMDVADQLKTTGKVKRGWLGVMIQDVTRELAESFGMKKPQGALVAQVLPESPALKGGLKVGDIILEFDDKEIERSSALPPVVGSSRVGEAIRVKVLRNGRTRTLKIVLGELPDEEESPTEVAAAAKAKTGRLGIAVSDLTDAQRSKLELDDTGVLVSEVQDGAAAQAGIRPQDVIVSINNIAVKDVEQFRDVVKGLPEGKTVPVLVRRRNGPLFLALKVPEDK